MSVSLAAGDPGLMSSLFVVLALAGLTALAMGRAGIAAIQLAPAFAFFPESNRDLDPDLDSVRGQAFATYGLLGYLLPTAVGQPGGAPGYEASPLPWLLQDLRSVVTGHLFTPPNYNYTEYAVTVGTAPLLAALVAVATGRRLAIGLAALAVALADLLQFVRICYILSRFAQFVRICAS